MNLGFNQNVNYNGEVFHVQTEDGGRNNPVITTTLFKGGVIITARRTGYSDIIKSDRLETVVAEIMREQHNSVIMELKTGAFAKKDK